MGKMKRYAEEKQPGIRMIAGRNVIIMMMPL